MTYTAPLRLMHAVIAAVLAAPMLPAQSAAPRPPVIDVHMHGTPEVSAGLARPDTLNVRYRLVSVTPIDVEKWQSVDRAKVLVSVSLPCDRGRGVITGVPCLANGASLPDTAWLRAQIKAGRIGALAELVPQYVGMSADDARLEPYWSIAEEFDIPVGIHIATGPPGAAYETSEAPFKSPEYRAAFTDPMLLEPVLLRHKKLRLFVMHAAYPMLESMLVMLNAHPGVYVDVGVLQNTRLVPRAAYYRHLRGLVESGFGKRILFGSDTPAGRLTMGIDAILAADFLTAEQKSDILCGNAMRFLRLPAATCQP